jgi:predicted AAA+ superfamily ATPase
MKRDIEPTILEDLKTKIVLLTGPRQSGKTTISKQITDSYDYLNVDSMEDLNKITKKYWDRDKELLILDEFHKFKNWKRFIKGVYDTEGLKPKIMITGSAKIDSFKNVGDSLAGRYFKHRLYPIDINEACKCNPSITQEEAFELIMHCSGFPEPFLKGEISFYKRWVKSHTEIILQQDLIDLTAVREISSITVLASLLKERVGSGVNYTNLAQDLQTTPKTVKKWVDLLENMYMFFRITPYHKNIARSLLKEPKVYCYDIASISDPGARLENLVAISLLKRLHFLEDTQGCLTALNYCRTKDGKEIDFLVQIESNFYLIEVKSSDDQVSKSFKYFKGFFEKARCIQLVKNLDKEYSNSSGTKVYNLVSWLKNIDKHLVYCQE